MTSYSTFKTPKVLGLRSELMAYLLPSDRLKALGDSVIAIMMLDLKPPHGATPHDLLADGPLSSPTSSASSMSPSTGTITNTSSPVTTAVDGLVLWANFAPLLLEAFIP